jgi:hypothetical protein
MTQRLNGGCQCGAVRYAVAGPLVDPGICHCRMCQKAVGGPFAAFASVPRDKLAWTRGQPAIFRSSSAGERGFCARCGTPLTFRYFHNDLIDFTLGSLDHPEAVPPEKEVGVESRVAWLRQAVCGGLPERTTIHPGSAAPVRALVNFQHPDHETPDGWAPPSP